MLSYHVLSDACSGEPSALSPSVPRVRRVQGLLAYGLGGSTGALGLVKGSVKATLTGSAMSPTKLGMKVLVVEIRRGGGPTTVFDALFRPGLVVSPGKLDLPFARGTILVACPADRLPILDGAATGDASGCELVLASVMPVARMAGKDPALADICGVALGSSRKRDRVGLSPGKGGTGGASSAGMNEAFGSESEDVDSVEKAETPPMLGEVELDVVGVASRLLPSVRRAEASLIPISSPPSNPTATNRLRFALPSALTDTHAQKVVDGARALCGPHTVAAAPRRGRRPSSAGRRTSGMVDVLANLTSRGRVEPILSRPLLDRRVTVR